MADKKLDTIGVKCPMPIVKISQTFRTMAVAETLEVLSDDPAFGEDVKAFCRVSGNGLVDFTENDGVFKVTIEKKSEGDH